MADIKVRLSNSEGFVFNEKRYREIAGVLIFLAGIIILLSLATYSKTDYRAIVHHRPVSNIIGPVGALIAHLARSAFGLSSYIFVISLFLSSLAQIRDGSISKATDRLFALVFLTVSSSILFSTGNMEIYQNGGGFTGYYIFHFFRSVAGTVGAYLIIAIMNIVGLILLGTLSVTSLLEKSKSRKDILLNRFAGFVSGRKQAEEVPLTSIEKKPASKTKRPPWIERKKILIGGGKNSREDELKYIEMKVTVETGKVDEFAALKESISSIPVSPGPFRSSVTASDFNTDYSPRDEETGYFDDDFDIPMNREIYSEETPFADDSPGEFSGDDEIIPDTQAITAKKNRIYSIDPEDHSDTGHPAGAVKTTFSADAGETRPI